MSQVEPPNPDDSGPIVLRPMGLPVTYGCDTAWDRTRVCSALDRCTTLETSLKLSEEATAQECPSVCVCLPFCVAVSYDANVMTTVLEDLSLGR
jgi:hypothetical protein